MGPTRCLFAILAVITTVVLAWGALPSSAPTATVPGVAPPNDAEPVSTGPSAPAPHHPGRVLVRFKESVTASRAEAALSDVPDALIVRTLRAVSGLKLITVPDGTVDDTIAALRGNPDVLYAEPDYRIRAFAIPNDPFFPSLWGLKNDGQTVNHDVGTEGADIRAIQAWDMWTGSQDFRIAVIDTGLDYTHPDLEPNVWTNSGEIGLDEQLHDKRTNGLDDDGNGFVDDVHGFNFIADNGNPLDDHGHGTHVAGTIGARGDNGIGITGVTWRCSLVALKCLADDGTGYMSDAVEAVRYAIDNDIHVSNNSWGCLSPTSSGCFSQSLYDVIEESASSGHLFIAAAGNYIAGLDSDLYPTYPASYDLPNIISVTATTNDDGIAGFSMYGQVTVDLGAPGLNIYSTALGGGYAFDSGTSMAAPHVTGAAAVVWTLNPELSWLDVKDQLLRSVHPLDTLSDLTVSGGRLDLVAALGDCNTNGIPDPDELANGTATDCNANLIIDECEADCNDNDVADDCDIAGTTSDDCNDNDRPDDCETGWDQDCNANGVPDLCDIHHSVAVDCNDNGVPDVCDLATGTSDDCNSNYVPDDCEYDCNENGSADSCDIATGVSDDLNDDGIPDECTLGVSLIPIGATGPHLIEGNQIFLPAGGLRVTFEVRLSGWDPDLDGHPLLRIYEIALDQSSFSNGVGDPVALARFPCATDDDCFGTLAAPSSCLSTGYCAYFSAIFVDEDHPTFVFSGEQTLSLGRFIGALSVLAIIGDFTGVVDQGDAKYAGTLILDVPIGAVGTFVVSFIEDSTFPILVAPPDSTNGYPPVPIPGISAALITLPLDCNNNGIDDACETACGSPGGTCDVPNCGTALDCNGNRIPDECMWAETDCNENATPDACDIATGESDDCNENRLPDECEFVDCNDNGILDVCDIEAGYSIDCNDNGEPDECDISQGSSYDCDDDMIPDECVDRADDCNHNSSPDWCDIDDLVSGDCDDDRVPDECIVEWDDCNENLVPDWCDLADGTSLDCDANQIPDECVEHSAHDCNMNLIPDTCDIDTGLSRDCNDNGRPDECEDCNQNGIGDECDLAANTSLDVNNNGVPDECDYIVFVDAGASGADDGASWADAFVDLQDALAEAADPTIQVTEIWVAQGVYKPDRGTGNRFASFELWNGVVVYGGFAAGTLVFDARDPTVNLTVLNGDLNGDDAPNGSGRDDNAYHVATVPLEAGQVVIDGFTMTSGQATGTEYVHQTGGGVQILGWGATVRNCVVVDNRATAGGGGIYIYSNAQIEDCLIARNASGSSGGGLFARYDSGITSVKRCVFEDNTASVGGGLNLNAGYLSRVSHSTFRGNLAHFGGGAYVWGTPTFANCLFSGNVATDNGYGGGMVIGSGLLTLLNCTLSENTGPEGGGLTDRWGASTTLTNCILWGNTSPTAIDVETAQITVASDSTVDVNHTCIQGWTGELDGTGNTGADPLFVNPAGEDGIPGTADDNPRLSLDSPCIDAGRNSAVPLEVTTDLDGGPRFIDDPTVVDTGVGAAPVVDLGAYEVGPDCNENSIADHADISSGASQDCNGDGIPNECDPDCNENMIPDGCDISSGASTDCNENGTLDECDLAEQASADCNANATPDECDIQDGTSLDCNDNGIPDACDIAAGVSMDCSGNGVPDECEECCVDSDCQDDGDPCTDELCYNDTCTSSENNVCGACCYRETGTCFDRVAPSDCDRERLIFTPGVTCEDLDRGCEPMLVAIPAVSSWGLVILALALAIGAKLYFRRSPRCTAH